MAMPKVVIREVQPKGVSPEEVKIHHDLGIKILARWIAQLEKEKQNIGRNHNMQNRVSN